MLFNYEREAVPKDSVLLMGSVFDPLGIMIYLDNKFDWLSFEIGRPMKNMMRIVLKRGFRWLGLNLAEMVREAGKL